MLHREEFISSHLKIRPGIPNFRRRPLGLNLFVKKVTFKGRPVKRRHFFFGSQFSLANPLREGLLRLSLLLLERTNFKMWKISLGKWNRHWLAQWKNIKKITKWINIQKQREKNIFFNKNSIFLRWPSQTVCNWAASSQKVGFLWNISDGKWCLVDPSPSPSFFLTVASGSGFLGPASDLVGVAAAGGCVHLYKLAKKAAER